jgi:transposase-like protein
VSLLSSLEELFVGRHFDREVIILCLRWYLRYKLSSRDLVEMMAERGLNLANTTILRWVRRYTPAGPLAVRGESRRPISRYAAAGPTSIERWTRLDRQSTSDSARHAM